MYTCTRVHVRVYTSKFSYFGIIPGRLPFTFSHFETGVYTCTRVHVDVYMDNQRFQNRGTRNNIALEWCIVDDHPTTFYEISEIHQYPSKSLISNILVISMIVRDIDDTGTVE